MERSKKRDLLWKKAILHFSLCFSLGFFLGFTPHSSRRLLFLPEIVPNLKSSRLGFDPVDRTPNPTLFVPPSNKAIHLPKLLITITTTATTSDDPLRRASLERLAQMLRLVPPPLLWIVVGPVGDAEPMARILRMTGIMYRHLIYANNLTNSKVKAEHERKIALEHVEYHRLDGIVHFADLSNVYDLRLFEAMREIEVLGTWPVASLSANKRRFTIEGPVCESSQVLGWRVKDTKSGDGAFGGWSSPRIGISGFAFNSSVLWDQDDSPLQDAMKYAREPTVDDESKIVAFPQDCSRVMLWTLHVPRGLV